MPIENTLHHVLVVTNDIHEELKKAITEHSLFSSAHEGYAVLLEELDELWDEVKKKSHKRNIKNMWTEAVQVAAMAMKFVMSLDAEWKSDPDTEDKLNDLEREAKCRACLYAVLSDEELDKLGTDPCDTCRDLCNWKPKEEAVEPVLVGP